MTQENRIGRKPVTAWIDEDAHRALKAALAHTGRTIQQVIEEAVSRELMREAIVDWDVMIGNIARVYAPTDPGGLATELQLTAETFIERTRQ